MNSNHCKFVAVCCPSTLDKPAKLNFSSQTVALTQFIMQTLKF